MKNLIVASRSNTTGPPIRSVEDECGIESRKRQPRGRASNCPRHFGGFGRDQLRSVWGAVTAVVITLALNANTMAQYDAPLYESEPRDAITLNTDQGGGVYYVFPLEFPDGKVPDNPQPSETLRIRLLDQPDRQYDIAWRHIAKIERFDQLILNEANALINRGEFDKAFKYLAYLRNTGADLSQLESAIIRLLQQDARAAIRSGRLHEALSLMDELYRLNPELRGLDRAVMDVTNRLFDDYLEKRNFVAARKMLSWAAERFGRRQLATTLAAWQKKLDARAALRMKEAREFLASDQMREAFDASREILQIAPDYPGGKELAAAIAERYISITVGVSRRANPNVLDGNDWSSRRIRRLLERSVVELSGIGPDGGQYYSPLATLQLGDDARSVVVKLRRNLEADNFHGFHLAEQLLSQTESKSKQAPLWAELVNRVSVRDVFDVNVEFKRSFLRPDALLQIPWTRATDQARPSQPYVMTGQDTDRLFLRVNDNYALRVANQPQDITEQFFTTTAAAVQAIERGEIDIIERIFPADLDLARSVENLTIDRYAIPSVHMLIPNFDRPFTGHRKFRRALVYGISRQTLLEQDLLGGERVPGCRLISGPFPAGRFDDDSLGYAYDSLLAPRPYEPRLAVTLAEIAFQELITAAGKSGEPAPERPQLRLMHPDGEIPRIASAGIAQYLTAVGIECDAITMPPGESWPTDNNWDLLYYDNVMADPILDAHRLLGAQGLCGGGSAYLELALRRLATTDNWADARTHLLRIHYLARQEAAVIPLWQLTDHFAYTPRVQGIEPEPVTLYERVESWNVQRAGNP